MNWLVDYVQPLTSWLQQNPSWSLFITFLISLAESLAIIGSIVPGSVTMTAIGIMAGSGIMRVDLTLVAAALGAVAGDSLSYLLGYVYSERLTEVWPFKKYPHWLQYGRDFFAIHGGKSVLIGRFIGPLRSIIPVIAGILHMKQWRFFIANSISAVGWSLLYVMPGVLIGAASHEMSTESATRMFMLILIALAIIWFLSLMIKWLFIQINVLCRRHLHTFWLKLESTPLLKYLFLALTPENEENFYPTASLVLVAFICLFCFLMLIILKLSGLSFAELNVPVFLFSQSFHTQLLQAFFIFCTQLTSTFTLCSLFTLYSLWFIHQKKPGLILFLLSIILFSSTISLVLNSLINSPRPYGLVFTAPGSSFPSVHLSIATALYGFLLFYVTKTCAILGNTPRTLVFSILGLSGLGAIYLGDNWLTDVLAAYFLGVTISLVHCLIYKKHQLHEKKKTSATLLLLIFFIGLFLPTTLITYTNYNLLVFNHTPYHEKYTLSDKVWWNQDNPILPEYRLSRIGKRISLLNIQYAGQLKLLQHALEQNGWEQRDESFFGNLLMRISAQSRELKLPLLSQLYENKPPALVMTFIDTQEKRVIELRLWESNYTLVSSKTPLWIGSIHLGNTPNKKPSKNPVNSALSLDALPYLFANENSFLIRQLMLSPKHIKPTAYPVQPYIMLMKSP